ncbi:MAG: hypothetical protein V4710_17225, partial [Verrucomicrobiota bacterium]
MKSILLSCLATFAVGILPRMASADYTDQFGTLKTIAGQLQSVTEDGNGNPINFWTPASEGALAKETTLSNPHIAAADAFGNIYIADKAS